MGGGVVGGVVDLAPQSPPILPGLLVTKLALRDKFLDDIPTRTGMRENFSCERSRERRWRIFLPTRT
jgi:hypothetical protein